MVPLTKYFATQRFGRRVRIDPQLLCEQIGTGAILAKGGAVSALSAIELHQRAMDTLLQRVGRQQPGGDANAGLDRAHGQMMVQQLGHGFQRHFAKSLTFRRRPALELGCGDLEALEKFAAIECDGLLQTFSFRLPNQIPEHDGIGGQRGWLKADCVLVSNQCAWVDVRQRLAHKAQRLSQAVARLHLAVVAP